METALEQSYKDLEEAKQKVAMIEKLKAFISVPIMTLHLFDDCWVTLAPMGLKDAIKFMKNLKAKKYRLRARKSTYNSSEDFELYALLTIDGTSVKLKIPVNDIKEPIMSFRRTGSTSRSKATGINVLKGIEPFSGYVVCHGLFTAEFYK